MADLRLNDAEGARLFQNVMSREQAGLLPITTGEDDPRTAPALRGQLLKQFWRRVFDAETNTLAGSTHERCLAAWRIMRYMATERGVIQPDDPLEEIGPMELQGSTFTSYREIDDKWLRDLLAQGVPLAPPPVPQHCIAGEGVTEDYEPAEDEVLQRWCKMIRYAGQGILGLDTSPSARRGYAWFTRPAMARAGWPPLPVLIHFEMKLVSEAVDYLLQNIERHARSEIASRWQLLPGEVEQVMALCRKSLVHRVNLNDRDALKAVAMAQLDEALGRARDAYDHRGEALIIKEKFRIAAYRDAVDDEDEFSDMSYIVSQAAAERRKKLT